MPSDSRRRLTVSRASITLTEKCLPTSRRNSSTDRPPVQSRLFTTIAPVGESSKSTNRSSWPRIRSAHSATASAEFRVRSPTSRGSPIMPVAPPASTIGRCPARWKRVQHEQRHQVAGVQARRGRVEPAVERDRAGVEVAPQRVEVGGLRDQAAPGQLVEDVRAHGRSILPHQVSRFPAGTAARAPSAAAPVRRSPRASRRPRTATARPCATATPTRGPVRIAGAGTAVAGAAAAPARPRSVRSTPLCVAVQPEQRRQPGRAPGQLGVAAAPSAGAARATSEAGDHLAGAQQHRAGARRRSGRRRWRRSACRRRSRRRGARPGRTSPRCAGSGRGSSATRGRRRRGRPPPRSAGPATVAGASITQPSRSFAASSGSTASSSR